MSRTPPSRAPRQTPTTHADPSQQQQQQQQQQEDLPMPDASPAQDGAKNRKPKDKNHILHASTFKSPAWAYMHLELITPETAATRTTSASAQPTLPTASLEPSTVATLLSPSLQSYLGLMGTSIPMDILRTRGREAWVRVPAADAGAVRASVAGWTGLCSVDMVPGVSEEGGVRSASGKVRVAWRVRTSGVGGGGLWGVNAGEGEGSALFEGGAKAI